MGPDRPVMQMTPEVARRLALQPWRLPTALRGVRAALSYLKGTMHYVAYWGRWTVDGDEVVHHVVGALVQDWVGTELRRTASFDESGGRLTLTAPPAEDGTIHVLEWVRGSLGEVPAGP